MNLSIRQKIWLPTLVIGLVFAVVAVGAALRTRHLVVESADNQVRLQSKLQLAHEWSTLTQANAARVSVALRTNDAALEDVVAKEVAATSAKISEIQKQIDGIAATDAEKVSLKKVADQRAAYVAARAEITQQKAADPASALQQFDARVAPALLAYVAAQKDFVAIQEAQVAAAQVLAGEQRMRTVWTVVAIMVVIFTAMVTSSAVLARHVCAPLKTAADAAERMAEGDLMVPISSARHDEVGQLLGALSRMQESLRRSVSAVRQTADSIQVASSEVASGNQDLSSRTEQTAGSLQQTASSMEQLTGTVRQTADSARTANQLASSAAQAAQRGGEVVTQVVHNMAEITTSSHKIAEIISVIDGIAFQTNILALNAAVEAARAGEQGRGFAVVAGEVRNLAQRSANAAKEIKSLINASVEKVESGSQLAQDAGHTMQEIVSGVQRVSDIIGEITAAASEQSSELGQINASVTQLDQMTQQNAALVEESAAAAESLKDQAVQLLDAVKVFRIEQAAQVSMASTPKPRPVPVKSVASASPAPRPAPVSRPAHAAPVAKPRPAEAKPVLATAAAGADDWETF